MLFKGRHLEAEIIVLCVRWYLRFSLSFRNLEEIMAERNLQRRSRHDLALGATVCAGTESPVPPRTAEDEPIMAGGRNVCSSRGQVDLIYTAQLIQQVRRSTFSLAFPQAIRGRG